MSMALGSQDTPFIRWSSVRLKHRFADGGIRFPQYLAKKSGKRDVNADGGRIRMRGGYADAKGEGYYEPLGETVEVVRA